MAVKTNKTSNLNKAKRTKWLAIAMLITVATVSLTLLDSEIVKATISFNGRGNEENETITGGIWQATTEAECKSGGEHNPFNNTESTQNACTRCFSGSSGVFQGALWFNDSPSDGNYDVVRVSDPNATTVPIYLWGSVYGCRTNYPRKSEAAARSIWFGEKGHTGGSSRDGTLDSPVDFISPNNAQMSKLRGTAYGLNLGWTSTATPAMADSVTSQGGWTLDVQKMKDYARSHPGDSTITTTSDGLERYEVEVSVNRCPGSAGINYYDSEYKKGKLKPCGGDNSKIIMEIGVADNSGFTSKSRVQSGSDTKESSDWGKDAETLEVTADSDGKATVYFSHKLAYRNSAPDGTYGDASTTGTITFNDGSNESYTIPFSTNGAVNAETPNWLTSDAGITKEITLNDGENEREICSYITYTTRTVKWSEGEPHQAEPVMDSGSTKACAKIKRGEEDAPEASGYFYSQSFIDIAAQNDVTTITAISDIDGMMDGENPGKAAYAEFSTDAETTRVKFYHKLSYVNEYQFAEDDVVPKVSTDWKIEENTNLSGTWETDGNKNSTSESLGTEEISVHLSKGETKMICRTDYYSPKYITMKVKEGGDHDGEDGHTTDHKYYEFEISQRSGEGRSQACVKITRPNDPEGTPWSGRGLDDSSPMFAGETTEIGWDVSAESVPTRRLAYYQSINFLVPVATQYDAVSLQLQGKLSNRTNITPCNFYQGLWINSGYNCVEMGRDSEALDYGPTIAEHTYSNPQTIAVPNEVGYKHCNSAGYFYEYWRKVCTFPDGCRWIHETTKDYWSIYNSSCRTIAKKPTTAIWNGGLMTSGNEASVTGVMARRFDSDDIFGHYADEVGSRTLYGSWTEHLAMIGGKALRFGSGSALGRGLANGEESNADEYSPLTVTNTDPSDLGHSGVFSTSTVSTRLNSYLRGTGGANPPGYGAYAGVNDLYNGWTGTRIVDVHGSLRIERSICTNGSNADGTCRASSTYADIYQIPQAIIFVDGDVEIAPEVREIDAWIIAGGEINTCVGFTVSDTETQAKNYPNTAKAICEKQLRFNGPVFASSLKLNRTFGSDPSTGSAKYEPAEIFNLSADVYLWAYAQAGRYKSSYTEAYSRELPPRY